MSRSTKLIPALTALALLTPSAGRAQDRADRKQPLAEGSILHAQGATAGSVYAWIPQGYPSLDIDTQGYAAWSADLRIDIEPYFHMHRGRYESNGLVAPTSEAAHVDSARGEQDFRYALLALMGGLRVSRTSDWEIMVRHDRQSYRSTVTPLQPTRFIPFETPPSQALTDFPLTTAPVTTYTAFETTTVGGLRKLPIRSPMAPLMFTGLSYVRYQKPYLLRSGDRYVPEFLFDARFAGLGLTVGSLLNTTSGKGGPFYEVRGTLGAGSVQIVEGVDIADLVNDDQSIVFMQGHIRTGYLFDVTVDDTFNVAAGFEGQFTVNYFYLMAKKDDSSSQGASSDDSPNLALNYDIITGGSAKVVVGF